MPFESSLEEGITRMGRVNIYIRKEDEALWERLQNKPEFLHQALNGAIHPDKDSIYIDKGQERPVARFDPEPVVLLDCKHPMKGFGCSSKTCPNYGG